MSSSVAIIMIAPGEGTLKSEHRCAFSLNEVLEEGLIDACFESQQALELGFKCHC